MNNTMTTEELDRMEALAPAAVSPQGQRNINDALELLDDLSFGASMPVQAAPRDERAMFEADYRRLIDLRASDDSVEMAWRNGSGKLWRAALAAKAQQAAPTGQQAEPVERPHDFRHESGSLFRRCARCEDIETPATPNACAAVPVSAAPTAAAVPSEQDAPLLQAVQALQRAKADLDAVQARAAGSHKHVDAANQYQGAIAKLISAAMSAAPAVEKEQQR